MTLTQGHGCCNVVVLGADKSLSSTTHQKHQRHQQHRQQVKQIAKVQTYAQNKKGDYNYSPIEQIVLARVRVVVHQFSTATNHTGGIPFSLDPVQSSHVGAGP